MNWKTPWVIGIAIGLAILLVGYGSDRNRARLDRKAYEQREKARDKKLQEALARAEAFNKSADAKEQKADQMGAVNERKAKDAEAEKAQIEAEEKRRQDEINAQFERDKAYINSNLSDCERVRDICARVARLDPNWQCDPTCPEPTEP